MYHCIFKPIIHPSIYIYCYRLKYKNMAGMEGLNSRGYSNQDYGVYRTRSEKYSNQYIEG